MIKISHQRTETAKAGYASTLGGVLQNETLVLWSTRSSVTVEVRQIMIQMQDINTEHLREGLSLQNTPLMGICGRLLPLMASATYRVILTEAKL